MNCEHPKPWSLSMETQAVKVPNRTHDVNDRYVPGRTAYIFECAHCGAELEWIWRDEYRLPFEAALKHAGINSEEEWHDVKLTPEARKAIDARVAQRMGRVEAIDTMKIKEKHGYPN